LIQKGETSAEGTKAIYKKAKFRGSDEQWAGAGVFGDVPVKNQVIEYGKETIVNPPYSSDAPGGKENITKIQAGTDVSQAETKIASTDISPENLNEKQAIDELQNKYGLLVYRIGQNGKYGIKKIATGETFEREGITPQKMLETLTAPKKTEEAKQAVPTTAPVTETNVPLQPMNNIQFKEHPLADYPSRTRINAASDATIALAVDFDSAGEKLTKNSVIAQGKKYIPIDLNKGLDVTPERVSKIVQMLNESTGSGLFAKKEISLNIAGNGIYTMKGKYTQQQLDDFTYNLLKAVTESSELKVTISSANTGGQTGMDEAGAKATQRLGIPTTVLAPKGYKFRNISGTDISNEQQFKQRFQQSNVPLQPIDWKSEINQLSKGKPEGWLEKARNIYTIGITAKLSPETILDNIKNC
jgi:hypothetical protein